MISMNLIRQGFAVGAIALAANAQAAPPSHAPASPPKTTASGPNESLGPVVAYNEAVRVINGKRVVQLPPRNPYGTKVFVPRFDGVYKPHAGYMIETEAGLVQCTVPFFEKEGCEPSTYGIKRTNRRWIVLRGGEWQACTGVEQPKKCRAVYPKPGSPDARATGVMPYEES